MKIQKFAVVVFINEQEVVDSNGSVYGWYESLATALKTATNLIQNGSFFHAVAMKCM